MIYDLPALKIAIFSLDLAIFSKGSDVVTTPPPPPLVCHYRLVGFSYNLRANDAIEPSKFSPSKVFPVSLHSISTFIT